MKAGDMAGWTLFLDRDGVINQRIVGQYVKQWDEFHFVDGVLHSLGQFAGLFKYIIVVTNQQGVGKGLMSAEQLESLHLEMCTEVASYGGRIDRCYYCPDLAMHNPLCRKPNTGMALAAQKDFPLIQFEKSIMVGDSLSDMEFGFRLNMKTVLIMGKEEEKELLDSGAYDHMIDWRYPSLATFCDSLFQD